ncbi:MAG: CDP-archaeol synthase, partial [Nanoarchaeota archaeon]|nr:CDP-archaeol synthase [Nanoarchaeota archaeon]
VPMSLQLGFLLGFGTVIGDMCGSFIKRRIGLKRGQSAPVLDQDDFLVGAFVFASLLVVIKWEWVVMMLIFTFIFHVIANRIGYWIHVKREPY